MTIDWWAVELRVSPPTSDDIAKAAKKVQDMPDSGDHGHVPAVFPMDPQQLPPIPEGSWDRAKLKTTKFKNLYASNEQLQRADLLWHVKNPGKSRFEGQYNTHAQVFQHKNGDRVAVDGNHRLAALKLLGIKKDKVFLLKEKDLPKS